MSQDETLKIAKSRKALEELLTRIETGKLEKPDWIRLQGDCRLDEMAEPTREALLRRLHGCVKMGFKDTSPAPKKRIARLDLWQSIARSGFHDFSEAGWTKNYDSPFLENYDYLAAYRAGGLEALDAYKVYSAVLGTFDFGVHDFVSTAMCEDVGTIVEPMAGTAEFCHAGHFRYPDFRYLMIDLDETAKERVLAQNWLPQTRKEYLIGDVLEQRMWEEIKSKSEGDSLAYIGKQSHHFFDAKQLFQFIKVATEHVDFLMLETPEICLASEMGDTDELTRPEMEDAGFDASLTGELDGEPNPLTHALSFRLEVRKGEKRRTLFNYHDWTYWSHATLVAFGRLLDLNVFYYHADREAFLPVDRWDEDADCEDNVTFMLFTHRRG